VSPRNNVAAQLADRSHFADVLVRGNRLVEARAEYERVVEDAQESGDSSTDELIYCHGRLMDIADASADRYNEHLHRGIGLWHLARKRLKLPDPGGAMPAEGLLCKAAAELTLARRERKHEARPSWYLYLVWAALGQRQPAMCQLHAAHEFSHFSYLTPAEQRSLLMAWHRSAAEKERD
jgi:hypothetical protein